MNLTIAYLTWILLGLAAWPLTWRLAGKKSGNVVPVYLARGLTLACLGLADFFLRSLWPAESLTNLHLILPAAFAILAWLPILWPKAWLPAAQPELDPAWWRKILFPWLGLHHFKDNLPRSGARWGATLGWEAVGLVCFTLVLAFLSIRTPVIQATEQFADLASLQSIAHSDKLPPEDWWFSGYKLNYHYLSFVPYARIGQVVGEKLTWRGDGASQSSAVGSQPSAVEENADTKALPKSPARPLTQSPDSLKLSAYPTVYVLSLAIAYSLAMLMAGGLVYSLSGRWWTVPLAIVLLTVAGNGHGAWSQMGTLTGTLPERLEKMSVWQSSRVIVDGPNRQNETINEYPLFSLQIGDLHPHVLNLPLVLAVAACLATLIRLPPRPGMTAVLSLAVLVSFAAVSMLLDIPGLGLVVFVGLLARILPASWKQGGWRTVVISRPTWGVALITGGLFIVSLGLFAQSFRTPVGGVVLDRNLAKPILGIANQLESQHQRPANAAKVLFEAATQPTLPPPNSVVYFPDPFYLVMSNAVPGIRWVDYPQSRWGEWMMLWGLPLTLLVGALWISHVRSRPTTRAGNALWLSVILFGVALGAVVRTVPSYVPFLTAVFLWVLCLRAAWRDKADRLQAFTFLLASVGLVLVAIPELMSIQDQYGGNYRINTIFKFYYQAQCWLLLSGLALLGWKFAPPRDVSENELDYQEQTGILPVNAAAPGADAVVMQEQETSGLENLWLAPMITLMGFGLILTGAILVQDWRDAGPRQDKRLAQRLKATCAEAQALDAAFLQMYFSSLREGKDLTTAGNLAQNQSQVASAAKELFAKEGGFLRAESRDGLWWWAENLDGTWWFRQDLPPQYAGDRSAAEFLNAHPPRDREERLLEAAVARQYGTELQTGYCIAGRLGLFGDWPSVLAWPNTHQVRRPGYVLPGETTSQVAQMQQREYQIQTMYQNPNSPQTRALLGAWHVRYLAVGRVEDEAYDDVAQLWVRSGWPLVLDGPTKIFDVSGAWVNPELASPPAGSGGGAKADAPGRPTTTTASQPMPRTRPVTPATPNEGGEP